MATVNENIQRIKTAKASIKASIEAKGVTVPADALIDTYAAKIDEIQTGGGLDIDLTGTGWETEPYFPIDFSRLDTLKEDIEYTKKKYAEYMASPAVIKDDQQLVYAPNLPVQDFTHYFYANCPNLFSVPFLTFTKALPLKILVNCPKLRYIKGIKMLEGGGLDLSASKELTRESVINILTNIEYAGIKRYIYLSQETLDLLTEADKKIAADKQWPVSVKPQQ